MFPIICQNNDMINLELKQYIENTILPQYDTFDKGHNCDHIHHVISESLLLARGYNVNKNMIYAIAAYHDIGIPLGRKEHHIFSGKILNDDKQLRKWFSENEMITMQQAIEDHRASAKNPPRSIYGCIVAEADRDISTETILRRTIQFGIKNYPKEPFPFHLQRATTHLKEKYGNGGYLKLYLHSSKNEQGLAKLRTLIANEKELEQQLHTIFDKETGVQ